MRTYAEYLCDGVQVDTRERELVDQPLAAPHAPLQEV
jgi:hypothetical protein